MGVIDSKKDRCTRQSAVLLQKKTVRKKGGVTTRGKSPTVRFNGGGGRGKRGKRYLFPPDSNHKNQMSKRFGGAPGDEPSRERGKKSKSRGDAEPQAES